MAGDWIKMQKSLPRDPRVVRISSALKADRLRTVGGLLSAWCLFDEQTEDGILEGYTPDLLDEIIGMPGLAMAMNSVGWLEIEGESLRVPRFDEHNGQSAKRRAQDVVRKMSARKADKCPPNKRTKSGLEKRRIEKSSIPPNPQVGDCVETDLLGNQFVQQPQKTFMPEGWKKMNASQQSRTRVFFNTPEMIEFGRLLGRGENTLWNVTEAIALQSVRPQKEEIDLIRLFYGAEIPKDQDFRRQNIETLLNNWNGELDKARAYKLSKR